MRLKKCTFLFLIVCLLLCPACSAVQKSELRQRADNVIGRLSTALDEMNEQISVHALEKSNSVFREPDYIDWQTSRHYYADLSEKEQLAYRCIYNGIFGQPERIAVPLLTTQELNTVFSALRYDNAQLLFIDDNASLLTAGMNCYFIPQYTLSYWEARETIVRCAEAARGILNQTDPADSQFETLLRLHDALCERSVYGDINARSSQCDGALLHSCATCAGYAKALKLMLDIAGIDSCGVTGTASADSSNPISHMWLAVCADGVWFYCDPTWDDPVSEDGRQAVEHAYFAMSHSRLLLTHSDVEKPSHISCAEQPQDYYDYMNLVCTQGYYRETIRNGIVQALENGKDFAEFRFDCLQTLQTANEELIEAGGVYALLSDAADYNENLLANRVGYSVDEKRLQLKLIFSFE